MTETPSPLGFVQDGKRPPGWTDEDERCWRGENIPTRTRKRFVGQGDTSDPEALRGIRAWLLAPTIEIYQALMRGEDVPISSLNPEAVQRYGLKR